MNYTRELTINTDEYGNTLRNDSYIAFMQCDDKRLKLPHNVEGRGTLLLTEPDCRFVTDEERKKFPKPNCAKFWDADSNDWCKVILFADKDWFDAYTYQVPNSFKFGPPEVIPTDEDACRRCRVVCKDTENEDWFEPIRTLAMVVKNDEYPFKVLCSNGSMSVYKYAKIVEDERQ